MTAGEIQVVRLGPQDWRAFKTVRLEAFRREPAAFSSTYDEAKTRPDERWQQMLANPRSLVLAALIETRPIGVVGAHLGSDEGDHTVAVIFGMYVDEQYRGQGLGRRLLSTLIALVADHPEIETIRLWVGQTQEPARHLYESLGFREIDQQARLLLSDDSPSELIMERPLQL